MKKTLFLFLFMLLPLMAGVYKQTTVKVYRGEGIGHTREEAINNALIEAIGQIHGVKMSKVTVSKDSLVETNDKSSLTSHFSNKLYKVTAGRVNHYTIEEVEQLDNNRYRAVVSVTKRKTRYKYKAPGHNPRNRRAIAVMPFEHKPSYNLFGITIDGKALSDRITQAVVSKITQTRKFTVLDRQNSRYYQMEKRFLLSGDSDPVELARLGKRLGTDYIIIGQIIDFSVDREAGNSLIGASDDRDVAVATISYRILNIPTQQIKWSNTFNIDVEAPNSRRAERIIAYVGDKIAQKLVDEIMFNIYPPKIIKTSGKQVIINMGGNVIHRGDRFEVFTLGKKLYDPYTKEYLGRDEKKIGEIEVTKVLPKISYAKVTSGKAKRGAILRPLPTSDEADDSQGKESTFDAMFPAQ